MDVSKPTIWIAVPGAAVPLNVKPLAASGPVAWGGDMVASQV